MKKNYLLLSLALCTSGLYAQFVENWNVRYQATPTNNYSNEGRRVALDASGNSFVLGDYSSDMDTLGQYTGTTQYTVRLQKYDNFGGLSARVFMSVGGLINNGFDNRSGFGLELDAAGNVYIGYSVLNSSGNFDLVIRKYSNTLSLKWTYTYATGNNDIGVDLKLNGNTAYAVVKSYSGANFTYSIVSANSTLTTSTPLYSFVNNVDVVNALNTTANKNVYVTGYSLVSGAKSAMTASVNTLGTLKWKMNFNHGSVTGDDYGTSLIVGTDGSLYIVGTTYTNVANGTDGLVLKYTSAGVIQGVLFLNQSAVDVGAKIASGPAGFVYAACSNVNAVSVYKIQMNPFSSNLNTSYFVVPSAPHTGITNVSVTDMKTAASGNVYVCGSVDATSTSGAFSASFLGKFGMNGFFFRLLNSQTVEGDFTSNYRPQCMVLDGVKNDIMILRNAWGTNSTHASESYVLSDWDGGTSLRLADQSTLPVNSVADVSVFPNPATDRISVRANEQIASIEICDLTGQVVKSVRVNAAADADVNIAGLRQGLYVCKVITESGAVTLKKLMIQ